MQPSRLAPLLLASACALSSDLPADESPAVDPGWRGLALVIRNTDITWIESGGPERQIATRLTPGEEAAALAELENLPDLFSLWSDDMGRMDLDVLLINDTLTSMTLIETDSYWVAPADVASLLDRFARPGQYDSIFVMFDPDVEEFTLPIDHSYSGNPSVATHGATFASLPVTWDEPSESSNPGEAHIHVWLHAASTYYRARGFPVPGPHENARYGYAEPDARGSWGAWYAAIMRGDLVDPDTGAQSGIAPDTWLEPPPRCGQGTVSCP